MLLALALMALSPCDAAEPAAVVTFASGSDSVDVDADAVLEEFAGAVDVDVFVCVVGHADDVGDADANLALGARRAAAVRARLEALRVDPATLLVASRGEREPAVQEPIDDDARRLNRRVVLRVAPRENADVVLDLPLQPKTHDPVDDSDDSDDNDNSVDDDDDVDENRRRARARRTLAAADPPARAWVVAAGAACGAVVGGGVCCAAPFAAGIGAQMAATADHTLAGPDVGVGATVGTVVGGIAGLATAASAVALVRSLPDEQRVAVGVGALVVVLVFPAAGAAVGAAMGSGSL
jgi:hypothetical protein